MKQKITSFMLACLVCAVGQAYDFGVGSWVYNITNSETNEVEVTYWVEDDGNANFYSGSISIPSQVGYNGVIYHVTGIGDNAFHDCYDLTSVSIPSSVKKIGFWAFGSCYNMQSVAIPYGVTTIGDYAFYYCSALTSLSIPYSVTDIENHAFSSCGGLTAIYIPSSISSIGEGAFSSCWNLTSIVVEEGNPYYDSRNDCNAIIETNSNTLVAGCSNTVIPDDVEAIGNRAFSGCYNMYNVTIPSSVKTIGEYAFESCSGLSSLTIPNGVTSIANYAFMNCNGLTSLSVEDGNPQYDSRDNCNAIIETGTNRLIVGFGNTVIPSSVTSIGTYAFANCNNLTSLTIPSNVTVIEDYAFAWCNGLESITIPKTVKEMGVGAFWNIWNLTSVTIASGVTAISSSAFGACYNLSSITIPNSVTYIGSGAFDGTPWYDNQADGVVYAGKVAYKYKGTMPADTKITLKSGTVGIAGGAFYDCDGLTSVTIPNSVTTISNSAFYGCDNLKSLTLGNSVKTIDGWAFGYCNALTAVNIPSSVTTIGDYAFYQCYNLKSVKMEKAAPISINWSQFDWRYQTLLCVPKGSKAAYQAANYWQDFKNIVEYPSTDVNQDEETDVVDVVDIARYVVGTASENFVVYLADLNEDEAVTVADAVVLVNEIAGDTDWESKSRNAEGVQAGMDELTLTRNADGSLSLSLDGNTDFTAFQFCLTLPEDTDVEGMMLNANRKQGHQLLFNRMDDGTYRVAALSVSNKAFRNRAGELLNILPAGLWDGLVTLTDIHFVTADGIDHVFDSLQLGEATGIGEIAGAEDESAGQPAIYNLGGQRLTAPQRGLNIINGKKVFIK